MPRKASPRAKASKSAGAPARFHDTPRLLSSDEKRELILAHAAARAPQDPLQRVSLWAGVTIASVVIVTGWFMTVGWKVGKTLSTGSEEVRQMTERLDRFSEQVESMPTLRELNLPRPTTEATAAEFETILKNHLASSTRTRDLLEPSGGTSTTSVPMEKPTDDYPGLIPDTP